MHFDHVQVAVDDLERAAHHYEQELGLVALAGGRHPGRGTANMIIPLGESYLELIAVVDPGEADAFPMSRRVAQAVAARRTFAAWAARTPDLEATRHHLEERGLDLPEAAEGWRRRPDGTELRWRMQDLISTTDFSALPFLIQWIAPPELFPGSAHVQHPSGGSGVSLVRLSDPDPKAASRRLSLVLDEDIEYAVVQGTPGVVEVVVRTPGGPLPIR